jgi:hypothetical protein
MHAIVLEMCVFGRRFAVVGVVGFGAGTLAFGLAWRSAYVSFRSRSQRTQKQGTTFHCEASDTRACVHELHGLVDSKIMMPG